MFKNMFKTLKIFCLQVCGGNFSGNSGEIYSPQWPFVYPLDSSCWYTINVPEGLVVELRLTSIGLGASDRYNQDYIQVCKCEISNTNLLIAGFIPFLTMGQSREFLGGFLEPSSSF